MPCLWLLIGDFNEMLLHQDKLGGASIKNSQLQRLPHLIRTHSAIDVPCHHQAYSWKGLARSGPIYERLNRALSPPQFQHEFNQSTLTYGNFTVSDNAPILFSSNPTPLTHAPPFRFQNFWVIVKDSHSLVRYH